MVFVIRFIEKYLTLKYEFAAALSRQKRRHNHGMNQSILIEFVNIFRHILAEIGYSFQMK